MASTITPFNTIADDTSPFAECVACGGSCPPGRRWCSTGCFYAEDGYPEPDEPLLDQADDDYWDKAA